MKNPASAFRAAFFLSVSALSVPGPAQAQSMEHARQDHHGHHAHDDHHNHQSHLTPDAVAPAGVMTDHLHGTGVFMLGLRYQYRGSDQYYKGGKQVSASELAEAGYTSMASEMNMEMLMLDVMYMPTDKLGLMLMPQLMRMDMSMTGTGAMTMQEHQGGPSHEGSHKVSGVGDTLLAALYDLSLNDDYQLVGSLGVSAPTGSADEKNADGTFVHYGMQIGSGTWDLAPALTYKDRSEALSWGAQINARIRLESANESGYALGDRYTLTTWSAWKLAPWISVSARLAYEQQGSIKGHYNGPHKHNSPADFQTNYGGEFVDAGLGANLVMRQGPLTGLRLELEWTTRLDEDYNGFQLGRDNGLNGTLSYSF